MPLANMAIDRSLRNAYDAIILELQAHNLKRSRGGREESRRARRYYSDGILEQTLGKEARYDLMMLL